LHHAQHFVARFARRGDKRNFDALSRLDNKGHAQGEDRIEHRARGAGQRLV
jgi:hypothetical protein